MMKPACWWLLLISVVTLPLLSEVHCNLTAVTKDPELNPAVKDIEPFVSSENETGFLTSTDEIGLLMSADENGTLTNANESDHLAHSNETDNLTKADETESFTNAGIPGSFVSADETGLLTSADENGPLTRRANETAALTSTDGIGFLTSSNETEFLLIPASVSDFNLSAESDEMIISGYRNDLLTSKKDMINYKSIFDEVGRSNDSLVDKILMIEKKACGNAGCPDYPYYIGTVIHAPLPCQLCYCDILCTKYGDCCPEVLLRYGQTYPSDDEAVGTCQQIFPLPMPDEVTSRQHYQSLIIKCPNRAKPNDTDEAAMPGSVPEPSVRELEEEANVSKCENPDLTDLDQTMFVTSVYGILTYRNIYCAACHNDTEWFYKWKAGFACLDSAPEFLTQMTSKEDLYNTLLSPEQTNKTGCRFLNRYPYLFYHRPCTYRRPDIISACNVSGVSRMSDPRLDEACSMYTSVFLHRYKNMFCYLCNLEYPLSWEEFYNFTTSPPQGNVGRVSFFALVDFDGHDHSNSFSEEGRISAEMTKECLAPEYYNPFRCACQVPVCAEAKHLTPEGSCHSLVCSNVLGYKLCLQIHLETETEMLMKDIVSFREQLKYPPSPDLLTHEDIVTKWCPESKTLDLATVDYFYSYNGLTLEELEVEVNTTINRYSTLATSTWLAIKISHLSVTNNCIDSSQAITACSTDQSIDFSPNYASNVESFSYSTFDENSTFFLVYLRTTHCPCIVLQKGNFTPSQEDEDKLVFGTTKKLIPRSQVDEISESEVRLCVSDYLSLTDTDVQVCKQTNTDFDTWTVSGLISIVCTCISLLCLFLTFITYTVFQSLRGGGDKNIMVLIMTLFTAQAFYEFAIEQFENRTACKAFGLIIHYTWLAAFFSMNACIIERFFKLCFPLQARVIFLSNKPFLWATTYTFLCPLVIVGINVLVNILIRGEDIGYGNPRLCYINTITSRMWAFAFPMGLVVVVNLCLMVITVCKLCRMSGLDRKSSSHNKVGLVVCARLSIVTGLTWLLTFLYEAVPWSGFSYAFTALIGLQGLFFFVSMVLNKRVLSLYSQRFLLDTEDRYTPACKQDQGGFRRKPTQDQTEKTASPPQSTSSTAAH